MVRKTCFAILLPLVTGSLFACNAITLETTTIGNNLGNATNGGSSVPPSTSNFYVFASNPNATYKNHAVASFTTECKVDSSSATKEVSCLAEVEELDLAFHGATVAVNVPSGSCDYVYASLPYYYKWKPGFGPSAYTVDTTAGGAPVVTITNGALGGFNGEPYCIYDYSDKNNPLSKNGKGPNCCQGTYTRTDISPPAVAGGANTVSITNQEWGGRAGDCIDGPAKSLMPSNSAGYPKSLVYHTKQAAFQQEFAMTSTMDSEGRGNYYTANYFDPADHPTNGVPMAFSEIDYTGFGATYGIIPATNPYYEFSCLDKAFELKSRLRLMIREWNTEAQFDLGATGDPEASGAEGAPFTGYDNNDFADWADLLDNAATSYPAMR